MKPPKREFEQVKTDEWLTGEIVDIQYEKDHEFSYKGNKSVDVAAKILIQLDGYKDRKSSGWMRFNYGQKSNLYKIFIAPIVEGAHPNMDFDLDLLKNLRIKVMYTQNGEYQNITMVRPAGSKILSTTKVDSTSPVDEEKVPF